MKATNFLTTIALIVAPAITLAGGEVSGGGIITMAEPGGAVVCMSAPQCLMLAGGESSGGTIADLIGPAKDLTRTSPGGCAVAKILEGYECIDLPGGGIIVRPIGGGLDDLFKAPPVDLGTAKPLFEPGDGIADPAKY
jgi:hypothetical protein